MSKLNISNLNKSIKGKEILKGISLTVDNGIYGVVGPNGAGKTTLFRCIAGLLSSRYDAITINDISINSAEYPFLIGYLPQAFSAFKNMTVYEMLYFFGKQKKITDSVISEQIDSALDMFNLKKEKDKKVKALSGGMLRRLGIAQSIMGDSKIILLDEPTVGLDVEERRRFWQVIGDFKNDRIVLISTHIINDVCTGCDNIILINEGKILYNGSVDELISGYSDVSQEDCMEINVENAYLYYMKGQA